MKCILFQEINLSLLVHVWHSHNQRRFVVKFNSAGTSYKSAHELKWNCAMIVIDMQPIRNVNLIVFRMKFLAEIKY
jgi:hypothetical protein